MEKILGEIQDLCVFARAHVCVGVCARVRGCRFSSRFVFRICACCVYECYGSAHTTHRPQSVTAQRAYPQVGKAADLVGQLALQAVALEIELAEKAQSRELRPE